MLRVGNNLDKMANLMFALRLWVPEGGLEPFRRVLLTTSKNPETSIAQCKLEISHFILTRLEPRQN